MLSPILACADVARAIDYYTEKLAFKLAWSMPPNEHGHLEFACVQLADAQILLGVTEGFVSLQDLTKRGLGVQIYISLPDELDIDALYDHVKSQGAIITREIETRDWGERAFNVKDRDGYNLMFAQQIEQDIA